MKKFLFLLVFVAFANVASAQLVTNPRTVEFTPSEDHSRVTENGSQAVDRYELRIFLRGAAAPLTSVDLGKPTPDATNTIRLQPPVLIGLPFGSYVARVAAIGAGGEGVSDPSNPFDSILAPGVPTLLKAVR